MFSFQYCIEDNAVLSIALYILCITCVSGIKEALRLSEVIKNEFGSTPKLKFIETTTSGMVTGFFVGSFWCKFLCIYFILNSHQLSC